MGWTPEVQGELCAWHECQRPETHVRQPQPIAIKAKTHPTWSAYWGTQLAKVCQGQCGRTEWNTDAVFCQAPHVCMSMAEGLFIVETRHKAIAHTRPVVPKIPWTPSASPKKRHLRHQTRNLAPPEKIRAWKDGSLRLKEHWSQLQDENAGPPRYPHQTASTDYHWSQDTPDLICVTRKHGQPKCIPAQWARTVSQNKIQTLHYY